MYTHIQATLKYAYAYVWDIRSYHAWLKVVSFLFQTFFKLKYSQPTHDTRCYISLGAHGMIQVYSLCCSYHLSPDCHYYRPIDCILCCAFHPRDLLMYLSLPLLLILEAASYEMGRRASPGVGRDRIVGSRHFLLCQLSRYYCPFHPVEGQQLESEFKTAAGQLRVSKNGWRPDRGPELPSLQT